MKIYLAARYARRQELLAYAKWLEGAGHEVTSRWVRQTELADWKWSDIAAADLADVRTAECLIAFTEPPLNEDVRAVERGGRHVELGYALALGMKVIVVGPPENIFTMLPEVFSYPDWHTFTAKWLVESVKYRKQQAR